jgi:hypothetical protein
VASSVSQGHDLLFLFFGQMSERYLHAELVVSDPGDGSFSEDLVAFLDIAGSKKSESLARRRLDFEGGASGVLDDDEIGLDGSLLCLIAIGDIFIG